MLKYNRYAYFWRCYVGNWYHLKHLPDMNIVLPDHIVLEYPKRMLLRRLTNFNRVCRLVAIAGAISPSPCHVVKSMQFIWNLPLSDLQMSRGDKLPWTSFISDWHTKLRIISKSAPGLATDSHCVLWGYGWTVCSLCGGPLLGSCFKGHLVCKFRTVERNFLLISCFYPGLHTSPKFCFIFLSYYFTLE